MRTKNAKRLWPVPLTLGVMALAALLAFGLMATNGAQPAAAQDKPDCTVPVDGANNALMVTETGGVIAGCSTTSASATVAVPGELGTATADATSAFVYAQGGTIAGGTTLRDVWDHDAAVGAKATTFSAIKVDIPAATVSLGSGTPIRAMPTITVTPSSGKSKVTLYVYYEAAVPVEDNLDHDGEGATEDVKQIDNPAEGTDSGELTITFLGSPALGKDLATDFNNDLDEDIMDQCIVNDDNAANNADARLVGEAPEGTCPAVGTAQNPSAVWEVAPIDDQTESRSKLVVRTIEDDDTLGEAKALIDGAMMTHKLMDDEDTFVIYALLEDAAGETLEDTEVTFTATTMPAGIVAPKDLSDDPDTMEVVSITGGDLADDQIRVTGLDPAVDGATPPTGAIIEAGDAVAAFSLDSLPDGGNDSYRIEVEVMAGSLNLGTVVIARTGTPTKVVAGVFNSACFTPGGEADDDYELATFDAEPEMDCDASGMARRFGAGEMIFVKAHHEDALDLVVGEDGALNSKLANEDDNLLGDADIVTIEDPVDRANGDPATAWIYMVDEDADLGDHMITVSTSELDKDDEPIADATVTITVAGTPESLSVSADSGTNYIALNSSADFTVSAADMLGGIPYFDRDSDDRNDKVTVSVQPVDALVVGTDNAGQVELDAYGEATFTVFSSLDASQGDAGRIIVRSGDLQYILPINFGEEVPPAPPELGDAMNAMATVNDDGSVSLSWTAGANATRHWVAGARQNDDGTFDTSVTVWSMADSDSSHMVAAEDLASGNWAFTVIAGDADGWGNWAPYGMATVN